MSIKYFIWNCFYRKGKLDFTCMCIGCMYAGGMVTPSNAFFTTLFVLPENTQKVKLKV